MENISDWVAIAISSLALVVSLILPARAARRREAFEVEQVKKIEDSNRRLREFESKIRGNEAVRLILLEGSRELETALGKVISSFENLLSESLRDASDDTMIQACKASLQPLIDLQGVADRVKLLIAQRHSEALTRFEDFLVKVFLDVRRSSDDRDNRYRKRVQRYQRSLMRYSHLAKKWIDEFHGIGD